MKIIMSKATPPYRERRKSCSRDILNKGRITVGVSSQCYRDEIMLLKCKLMLLECQINTNTDKNGFLLSTKCLERVLKYSYLVSII